MAGRVKGLWEREGDLLWLQIGRDPGSLGRHLRVCEIYVICVI